VFADAAGNRNDPEPPTSLTRRLKLASILSRLRSLQSASNRRRASGVISAMTSPELLRSRRKRPASVREGRLVEGVGKANSSTRPSPCPSVHQHARSIIAVRRSSLLDVWKNFLCRTGLVYGDQCDPVLAIPADQQSRNANLLMCTCTCIYIPSLASYRITSSTAVRSTKSKQIDQINARRVASR
jgi:hypothetical protein